MQTIQMQGQESIRLFRKKRFKILLLIAIPAMIVFIFFLNSDKYSAKIYNDPEQVFAVFENNYDDFETFMDVIDGNSAFHDLLIEKSKSHTSIYKEMKKYMSEEEYKVVEYFWTTYRPYCMGSGWIDFRVNKEAFSIELFSCRDMSETQKEKYLSYRSQYGVVKQIRSEGEWYSLIYCNND